MQTNSPSIYLLDNLYFSYTNTSKMDWAIELKSYQIIPNNLSSTSDQFLPLYSQIYFFFPPLYHCLKLNQTIIISLRPD